MAEIVSAEAKGGIIHAQDTEGRLYEIYIDDRGEPHTGRTNTWMIPEGENAKAGHIVELLLPTGPSYGILGVPLRVKVRHADA